MTTEPDSLILLYYNITQYGLAELKCCHYPPFLPHLRYLQQNMTQSTVK